MKFTHPSIQTNKQQDKLPASKHPSSSKALLLVRDQFKSTIFENTIHPNIQESILLISVPQYDSALHSSSFSEFSLNTQIDCSGKSVLQSWIRIQHKHINKQI